MPTLLSRADYTAYILIGVEEVTGGRGEVVGVEKHLEDASLHQFVNHKTNRPVVFSYSVHAIEGKRIGAIVIPIQQRPIWTEKDYGVVRANEVYVRDGSSTRPASPDEIAAMGRGNPPMLQVEWGDATERIVYPPGYVHRSTHLNMPDQFQTLKGGARHYDYKDLARELGENPARYTEDSNSVNEQAIGAPFLQQHGREGWATLEDRSICATAK